MATAGDIAERAFKRILVEADDSGMDPSDYADFISSMNDYMASLEAVGVRLGYTPVSIGSDEVTVPPATVRGIIANMAIEVATDYGAEIPPGLAMQAKQGLRAMRHIGRPNMQVAFPSTLPVGSGNQRNTWRRHFHGYQAFAACGLSGNTSPTEFATTGDSGRVAGFWNISKSVRFRADITGRITNSDRVTIDSHILADMSVSGDGDYKFHIMHNGESIRSVDAALTSAISSVSLSTMAFLEPEDYVEVWVESVSGTEPVVIASGQFEVAN